MRVPTLPKPPAGLSPEAKAWWRKLVDEYELTDQAGQLLLRTALEALDRMRQAQDLIRKQGATFQDRFGQIKTNPAVVIERDARAGMLAALAKLNFDLEPIRDRAGRPSGSR